MGLQDGTNEENEPQGTQVNCHLIVDQGSRPTLPNSRTQLLNHDAKTVSLARKKKKKSAEKATKGKITHFKCKEIRKCNGSSGIQGQTPLIQSRSFAFQVFSAHGFSLVERGQWYGRGQTVTYCFTCIFSLNLDNVPWGWGGMLLFHFFNEKSEI